MKRRTKAYVSTFGVTGLFIVVLHAFGYRIYGHPHMYWPKPDRNEDWTHVSAFHAPSSIELGDGRLVDFSPFELTETGKTLAHDELACSIFRTRLEDLYLRETNEGIWMARMQNRFTCSLPSWFPDRVYGYHEVELKNQLYYGDITKDPKERVVDLRNEEAAHEYLNKIRQN